MSNSAYSNYDPNGVGVDNGNFLGLPIVDNPAIEFIAVPYDATVSYGAGTAGGPVNLLTASTQLDVCLFGLDKPWELGFRWETLVSPAITRLPDDRARVESIIAKLESGEDLAQGDHAAYEQLAHSGEEICTALRTHVSSSLSAKQFPVVVGGEHAISLGAFQACDQFGDFGILHIDAHLDLRQAYEGFTYSHASVMYNALKSCPNLKKLVSVGIRDYCPAELELAAAEGDRVDVHFAAAIQAKHFRNESWDAQVQAIIASLPDRVWISFDIDGLDPAFCMHTGTPVPGGLSFAEAKYLCTQVVASGREVIGMDIVEIAPAPYEYEGAVAARLAYEIACTAVLNRQ